MVKLAVTVVITNLNAEKTITDAIRSVLTQGYPISEIIVIDNHSTDRSIALVEKLAGRKTTYPIRIIRREKNYGIIPSYIRGVKEAKTDYVITMHSDSVLPGSGEIRLLMEPFNNSAVVASYPRVMLPQSVWDGYDFWQKFLFASAVGKDSPGLNGKFDCFKKSSFLRVAKVWQQRFQNTNESGGEDWDLHVRLKKVGKVIASRARVYHLHYISEPFDVRQVLIKRRHLARSYGKLLRLHGFSLGLAGVFAFSLRPALAIGTFLPFAQLVVFPLVILFAIVYMRTMFLTPSTVRDTRIFLVPFVAIGMVYYEAFWTIRSFLGI